MPPMRRFTSTSLFGPGAGVCLLVTSLLAAGASFDKATVTKIEHSVLLGERQAEKSVTRPAVVRDVMQARNFLRSENASRAELEYPDGTVVRVGQNTVFSFDSGSRTLTLESGSLLFHIPKNSGGGTIKTASLTAAITGTAGKVSDNVIAIVEGEVKLIPGGQVVRAGEFARRNADGSITVARFDRDKVLEGKLVFFNGLMPGFPEKALATSVEPAFPPQLLRDLEVQSRTQNLPGSINVYFPEPKVKKIEVKKDEPPRVIATPTPRIVRPTVPSSPKPTGRPNPGL
jgi:FecR-like protein